jgi:tetratricopeptide (TPR) repeat protein
MLKYITLLVLLLSSLQATAQLKGQARIDSLEAELINAKGDTNEVNILSTLSFYYYTIDTDRGIEFGNKSLNLAQQIKWKKGESNANNSLGVNYYAKSDFSKALEHFENSLAINKELDNKYGMASNFGNIGSVYENLSEYPKSLEFYKKALKIEEELGRESGIASNLGNMGNIYKYQLDY